MQQSVLKSVLYVDDDAGIRQVVQIALELKGTITVSTADCGEEALALARARKPDLMLLDVMMPGIDGPATLKALRADATLSKIPVVFITAKAPPHEVARLRELGSVGVIAKPFDPVQLESHVRSIWGGLSERSAPRLDQDLPEELQEEVKALHDAFLVRTRTEAVTMRVLVERSLAGDRSALTQLEMLTHRIHGTGAVFGFNAISDCAEGLERMAERLLIQGASGDANLDRLAANDLQACYGQLVTEIETASRDAVANG
jgi:two-component system, OmpR family, response regulator